MGASDHVSILINLACSPETNYFNLVRPNYHKGNCEEIRSDLSSVKWKQLKTMSVTEGYDFIVNEVKSVVEKHVPLKGNNKNFRKKKWANKDCLKSVKNNYKAWKTYVHTKTAENYRKCCVARNHCTKVTRSAKRNFEKLTVQDIRTNTKVFWSYVREQAKSRTKMSDLKDESGQKVTDSKEKANLLNNFFASVFVNEPSVPLPIFDI